VDAHLNFLLRIIICFLLSSLIGLEREFRGKSVGLRTNVIVGLGSFLFESASSEIVGFDYTRIAAQVVSGIGFLGAGAIVINNNDVRGLNTAATMWCVAAIGVLVSLNLVFEAVLGTVAILITNLFISKIRCGIQLSHDHEDRFQIRIAYEDKFRDHVLKIINQVLDKDYVFKIDNIDQDLNRKYHTIKLVIDNISSFKLRTLIKELKNQRYVNYVRFNDTDNDDI
jgi:uncharacterized membrane protein YhiD involved in acid resistance